MPLSPAETVVAKKAHRNITIVLFNMSEAPPD